MELLYITECNLITDVGLGYLAQVSFKLKIQVEKLGMSYA
jgi:hypothetical protein